MGGWCNFSDLEYNVHSYLVQTLPVESFVLRVIMNLKCSM